MPRLASRLFELALQAYPPRFRREYGPGMATAFARGWAAAAKQGARRTWLYGCGALVDWAVSVPREWLDVARNREGDRMKGSRTEQLLQDIRYGLKGLRSRPAMTLALAITLGLGVGGITAIEGVLRDTLFRGLPYDEPDQIRVFSDAGSWAPSDLAAIEDGSPVLTSVAAYHSTQVVIEAPDGGVSAVDALVVSRDFFQVLGRPLQMGAGFEPSDFSPDGGMSVVLSQSLWEEMGGSPSLVGSYMRLDGVDARVAGVTPEGFYYPDPGTRIFVPMQLDPGSRDRFLTAIARIPPLVRDADISAEADRVTGILGRSDEEGAQPIALLPLRGAVFEEGRDSMLLTAGALALVLLMAVINVGTLLLSHLHSRQRELALRRAIGATRARLARQLVTEAGLLGLLGAVAALVVGVLGHRLLVANLPLASGDALLLSVGPRFVVLTIGLGVVIGGLTGLGVSLLVPVAESPLGVGGARRATPRAAFVQHSLVLAQIALSVALVGGAGVMVRSVGALSGIEIGIAAGEAVVIEVVATAADFPPERRAQLYQEVRSGIGALPGTESVGMTQKLPLRGSGWSTSVREPGSTVEPSFVTIRFVTAGYFEALGVPLITGRSVDGAIDVEGARLVAWVNQSLARELWPGAPSEGRELSTWGAAREIVGVVGDVSEGGLRDSAAPTIYVPLEQLPRFLSFTVLARPSAAAAAGYAGRLQAWLRATHPNLAIQEVASFADIEAQAKGDSLMVMRLLLVVGMLALIVGAVGIHGVVSQWVSGRVRGWAVSMVLGATAGTVLLAVLRRTSALVGGGVTLGIALYWAGGAALESFIYGVARIDAFTIAITAVVMMATGLIGAAVPAYRASRTDPVTLLKIQ